MELREAQALTGENLAGITMISGGWLEFANLELGAVQVLEGLLGYCLGKLRRTQRGQDHDQVI
jgi:hypothetical protein